MHFDGGLLGVNGSLIHGIAVAAVIVGGCGRISILENQDASVGASVRCF
jgi:hypothetical protein